MAKTCLKSFSLTKVIHNKSPHFLMFWWMLCTATPDIFSSSKNINSTDRVSRLSFRFLWLWYDRTWSFISKKYNFILWTSFFLSTLNFNTWKIKATSHKIYCPSSHFEQCWWVCKLHRTHAADKLLLNRNIDAGEG